LHHIIFFAPFTAKTLCFRNIVETPPHHITLGIPSLPLAQRMGIRTLARDYTTVVMRVWW